MSLLHLSLSLPALAGATSSPADVALACNEAASRLGSALETAPPRIASPKPAPVAAGDAYVAEVPICSPADGRPIGDVLFEVEVRDDWPWLLHVFNTAGAYVLERWPTDGSDWLGFIAHGAGLRSIVDFERLRVEMNDERSAWALICAEREVVRTSLPAAVRPALAALVELAMARSNQTALEAHEATMRHHPRWYDDPGHALTGFFYRRGLADADLVPLYRAAVVLVAADLRHPAAAGYLAQVRAEVHASGLGPEAEVLASLDAAKGRLPAR